VDGRRWTLDKPPRTYRRGIPPGNQPLRSVSIIKFMAEPPRDALVVRFQLNDHGRVPIPAVWESTFRIGSTFLA
jgi:hypothetical protein